MRRHALAGLILLALGFAPAGARAERNGLITQPSRYDARTTLDRFAAAVRKAEWVVFTELDHAAAARAVGMELAARTVVLFGNPRAGTSAMAAHPTLAIDLPMRVLVWQDAQGKIFVTRGSGAYIATRVFARHGIEIPPEGQKGTDDFIADLVRQATE